MAYSSQVFLWTASTNLAVYINAGFETDMQRLTSRLDACLCSAGLLVQQLLLIEVYNNSASNLASSQSLNTLIKSGNASYLRNTFK